MAIPQYFIQDLLNRIDIVDFIQSRVAIKKRGANYQGLCPFHQEKSPSFTVSQPKQFYHCFGCGKHGNVIGFLMDYDRLDFIEAIEELARQLGLEIPREHQAGMQEKKEDYQSLYHLIEKSCFFFEECLKNHPLRARAVHYLKTRGLTGSTAKHFSLGFVPPGWDHLLNYLQPTPTEIPALKQSGLISENDVGKIYDKFRDRIMFPIRDRRGRVVAFGGRIIDQGEPKYLNSPETPLFHKGKLLYGLYEAKQRRDKFQQIVVVEGYMDVVMLFQHGIDYAVATLGTATTSDHIRLLKQECSEIIFAFDGDQAGREAAWRALKTALPFMTGELDLRFLFLPEGEDPDSLVQREGKEAFEKRLRIHTVSLADFVMAKLDENLNLNTLAGKSRWITLFKPLAALLPMGPYQTFLVDTIAKRFNFSFEQVTHLISSETASFEILPSARQDSITLIEKGLSLLLQNPRLALLDLVYPVNNEDAQELIQLIQIIQSQNLQTTGQVIEFFRDDSQQEKFARLAFHSYPTEIKDTVGEWQDLIAKLNVSWEAELEILQNSAMKRPLTSTENHRLLELYNQRKSS